MDNDEANSGKHKHCRQDKKGCRIGAVDYVVIRIPADVCVYTWCEGIFAVIVVGHFINALIQRNAAAQK